MFALFVMVILVVGIIATLGISILSFQRTAEMTSLVQRNSARMEVVSTIMRSASRPVLAGGLLRAPVGPVADEGEAAGRMVLPAEMVGDNRTPWGAYYGYCPAILPNTPVPDGDGAHAVDVNGTEVYAKTLAGRDYIVSGPLPALNVVSGEAPSGILGFVVSPTPNRYVLPDCGEIIYRDGAFLIGTASGDAALAGGTVVPIMADVGSLSYMPPEIEPILYVSPTRMGDGTGAMPDQAMSLHEAVAYWIAAKPRRLTLVLSGSFTLADNENLSFVLPSDGTGRFLRLTDATPLDQDEGASIDTAGRAWLKIASETVVEGILLGDGVGIHALPGSEVTISASTLGRLRVDGGDVLVRSDTSIIHGSSWGATSPIELSSGSVRIAQAPSGGALSIGSNATTVPAIRATGGTLSILADIDAAGFDLPWSLSGGSSFDVGQRAFSSGVPNVVYSAGTVAISPTAAGTSGAIDGNGIAAAVCPPLHPNVVNGGCNAASGMLSGSGPTANGWQCRWSSLETIPPILLPSGATAGATCSAAPSR